MFFKQNEFKRKKKTYGKRRKRTEFQQFYNLCKFILYLIEFYYYTHSFESFISLVRSLWFERNSNRQRKCNNNSIFFFAHCYEPTANSNLQLHFWLNHSSKLRWFNLWRSISFVCNSLARSLSLLSRDLILEYTHIHSYTLAFSIYAVFGVFTSCSKRLSRHLLHNIATKSTQSVVQKTLYKISLAAKILWNYDVHLENVLNAKARIQCELQNGFRRRRRSKKNVLAISRYYGIPIRSVCVYIATHLGASMLDEPCCCIDHFKY